MFCPDDGTEIPYDSELDAGVMAYYNACSKCGNYYLYESEAGTYQVISKEEFLAATEEMEDEPSLEYKS